MTTVHLYELSAAREILEDWLSEAEGEWTPEIEALLTELDGKADEKIERVALFIREQLADADRIKTEEQRLAARRKSREKAADSLKSYLQREMERLGKTSVNGLLCTVAFQNNPPSVRGDVSPFVLQDLLESKSLFVTEIPASFSLNRRAVIDAFKSGQPIPDGLVVEQGISLRIR